MNNIYGDWESKTTESLGTTESVTKVAVIDGDGNATLSDVIHMISNILTDTPNDVSVTLYIVKGKYTLPNFSWRLLWDYLHSTGREFNVVVRGYIVDIEFLLGFSLKNLTFYLPPNTPYIDFLKSKSFKFELYESV